MVESTGLLSQSFAVLGTSKKRQLPSQVEPMLDSVLCQIDSSSKPCFEEEIIKCVVLEYVIYSPDLQMAANSSSYPYTSTIQNIHFS